MRFLRPLSEATFTLLRLIAGLMFACHGFQKLFGVLGGQRPPLFSIFGAAGIIESVTGVLIAIGLWASPAAFIASGEMAVAYFRAHAPKAFFPIQNGGEPAVLYCFLFLYIAARGSGRFAVKPD
jgi:putative oxidoreductase